MTDPSEPVPEPANLRFLRRLVTTLTAVMIFGLLVIVGLLVIRFSTDQRDTPLPLPDEIALPDGAEARAITIADDYYAVLTTDDTLLVYDRANGTLLSTIPIRTQPAVKE